MALGNSNTSAQSRGKNKPILVKRRKEIVAAKDYNSISGTTVQARAACGYSGSLSETYYHNGGRSTPSVNDKVYILRRADNERGVLQNGFYKVTANNRDFFSIQIRYGVVAAVENCR
tara:strand:- start:1029 stop:1379 length:351 start_codon:yes stop_codon:yes gene_type:complete